jgi:hypothetical protein
MTVDDTYSTLEDAKIEIWKRFNNQSLKKEIEAFLDPFILSQLPYKHTPIAWRAIHVVSPDVSLHHFIKLAEEIQLPPVVSQYIEDKFCPKNKDKYHLGKLYFYEGLGKHGGYKMSSLRSINFNYWEGTPLNKIKTLWGEDFVNFHQNILLNSTIKNQIKMFGFSEWINTNNKSVQQYYLQFLSLLLCHAVLFENYLTTNSYKDFSNNIYLPAFEKVQSLFGIKPLVVRLAPKESEDDLYWYCYPDYLKPIVYEHITRQNPDFLIK